MRKSKESSKTVPDTAAYHIPVMPGPALAGLDLKEAGVYVDATFGGGGHSRLILQHLKDGKLIAFDQDPDAAENIGDLKQHPNFSFIPTNFRFMKRYLEANGIGFVDGILADLGVSSHQFDVPERGFSIRFDGPLDMRMNPGESTLTARDILNSYTPEQLQQVLSSYGEVRNARTLAAAIVSARTRAPFRTAGELTDFLSVYAPKFRENKYFAQVFQAIRIEVNRELESLKEFLMQASEVIRPGGRLVVVSYHSLEDRLVKNFIMKGNFAGEPEKDFYGNLLVPFEPLVRKPLEPDSDEILRNPRARSARLRVAERLTNKN